MSVQEYREERQRQEADLERVSLGYQTEAADILTTVKLIDFRQWLYHRRTAN